MRPFATNWSCFGLFWGVCLMLDAATACSEFRSQATSRHCQLCCLFAFALAPLGQDLNPNSTLTLHREQDALSQILSELLKAVT